MEIRKGPEVKASPLKKRDAKLKTKENAEILKDKSSRISDGGDCKSNRQLQEPPCAVTDCVPISKRQKVTPTD